jgi:extracellular elastinolytic metalloproteinase
MRRTMTSLALALAVVAGFALPAAGGAEPMRPADFFVDLGERFDVRDGSVAIPLTSRQSRALVRLVREHPDVHLDWSTQFGTPRSVLRHGATLTGPARGTAPQRVARAWLAEHASLYGWSRADVAALRVARILTQPRGGPVMVLFHQAFAGLEGGSFGGSTVVSLDRANRILTVRSKVVPSTDIAGSARLTAADALRAVAGIAQPRVTGHRGVGYTEFARGGYAARHHVRPVAFPMPGAPARPAYEVMFAKHLDEGYRMAVDAITGEVLYRWQLVQHLDGRVFRNYPGAPKGGEHEIVSFDGDQNASPNGWTPGGVPVSIGSNAHTFTNWSPSGILVPDGGQLRAAGTFDFPFSDAWARSNCGENPIGSPQTPTYAQDTPAAIVNLFYHHNLMHDFWWNLGFTGAAGAMQALNFEEDASPDTAGDPLLGMVQAAAVGGDLPPDDPAGRDNAYMFTNDDGLPQWSAMFLFQPIPPAPPSGAGFLAACADGDFAADVIYHEYAHGVTNRWVGGEFGNLDTSQGGAMGESWSDLYALHYLHSRGLETSTNLASYDTGTRQRSFRNWKLAEVPVGFGDLGYDVNGDEVHSDGEIWNGTIWDLRAALMKARGDKGEYAMQIVADAMPISGPSPSMLDMRDAILAADVARSKGRYQDLMWKVFASRGMGISATSGKGGSKAKRDGSEITPHPAFDHAKARFNGKLAGSLVDARTGKRISGARIIVGSYEARVSPVTHSGKSGTFSFPIAAGRHPLTIAARGYGVRTVPFSVAAGRTTSKRFELQVNLASKAAGAKVVDVSNPSELGLPDFALDDTEQSTWWTLPDGKARGEFFVVDLAGDAPVSIREVQVSAMRALGGSRFDAVKRFSIHTSLDGKRFTKVLTGSFSWAPPRPLTPDLHYRSWRLARSTKAKFLKFVAEEPMVDYGGGIQVADVQAFGTGGVTVRAGEAGGDKPIHDEGMMLVATTGNDPATPSPTLQLYRQGGQAGVCPFPPPTQGVDAWVTELPDSFNDANHVIDVESHPLETDPLPDVDLYFFSKTCKETGRIATPSPHESGFIPQGSKYVLTQLWSALPTTITVDAESS